MRPESRPPSSAELAVLGHPDRQTGWVVVVSAELATPDPSLVGQILARLPALCAQAPLLRSRMRAGVWNAGAPPRPILCDENPLTVAELTAPFRLSDEPPIRVLVDRGGARVAVAAHHAALDGLAMVSLLAALIGDAPLLPSAKRVAGAPDPVALGDLRAPLRRLLAPADRIAPSVEPEPVDVLTMVEIDIAPPNITGRLAAAAVAAAAAHNASRGRRWRRIGLTVAVGGPPLLGNVASYRRLDLRPDDDIAAAVHDALHGGLGMPLSATSMPHLVKLMGPLAGRLSDSLLVSNLGAQDLPEARNLALFPVARGRSAVAIGAASCFPGRTTVSLRARDLALGEARALLDDVVRRLARVAPLPVA